MLEDFAATIIDYRDKIENAIANRDVGGLAREAHSLKGLCLNFGAPILMQTASEIEQMAQNSDIDRCLAMLDQLKSTATRTEAAAREHVRQWRAAAVAESTPDSR